MLSLVTASVVVETEAMKQTTDVTGNEAVGAMTRLMLVIWSSVCK